MSSEILNCFALSITFSWWRSYRKKHKLSWDHSKVTCLVKNTYPYEKLSVALHREMTDAASPASRAVQSKNMW